MIRLKEFSFSYLRPDGSPASETPLLNRVNLNIPKGEFVLVCGPTGSGKSTLLKALTGLAPSFTGGLISGQVVIDGQDLTGKPPFDYANLVGYVNQQPEGAFVADTVLDEIVYGAEQLGKPLAEIDEKLKEVTALLGLTELLKRDLASLSGGQQQRVAIASALIAGQRLLLLDEPTSALDHSGANDVLKTLKSLAHTHGVTVLLAEHRISRVIAEVDSVLVVHGDGSVTKGKPETQFNDNRFAPPIIELGIKLGWKPLSIDLASATANWKNGQHSFSPRVKSSAGSEILKVSDLSLSYGKVAALNSINASFFGNQITAVMGENGSGKTSLCWAIQGLGERSSGSVLLGDIDTAELAKQSRLDQVAMVPQRAADLLFLHSLAEELAESDRFAEAEVGSTAKLFMGLAGRIDTAIHPRDLSAGQQLALVLAIQLVKGAKVLILDEPTRGLDYAAKRALAKQLTALKNRDRSIILASHDIEFVTMVADRVLVLTEGEIISDNSPEDVMAWDKPLASQIALITKTEGLITLEQVDR
ncbi:MAG: ATP-binding cassette domain-containing protein [Bacteroidetes bacterium]|nr:ATP-binding cassette domain-containing protein [Microbacteriaceae bacterium]NBS60739.1 ATP-binding cassette domain-containing protein [Microbacteriaceae bacterium]NBT47844.1 ATP-binding cassette domain-containing protein [Actinomycetota bacterium]NBU70335.1 ATP-binding cassette domain-containing protein [Bacteroidota bacterium]